MDDTNIDNLTNIFEMKNVRSMRLKSAFSFVLCTLTGTGLFLFFIFVQTKFNYEIFKNYLNLEIIIYITAYSCFICPRLLKVLLKNSNNIVKTKSVAKTFSLSKIVLSCFFVLLVVDCIRFIHSGSSICPITVNFGRLILGLDIDNFDLSSSSDCLNIYDFCAIIFIELSFMFIYGYLKNSISFYKLNKNVKTSIEERYNSKNIRKSKFLSSKFACYSLDKFDDEYFFNNKKFDESKAIFLKSEKYITQNFSWIFNLSK